MDDAAYDGDAAASAGSVSYASPSLTWTGDLFAGGIRDDHIRSPWTTRTPATVSLTNTVSTSPAAGSNCPAGSADPARCTVTVTLVAAPPP